MRVSFNKLWHTCPVEYYAAIAERPFRNTEKVV
jgi:hypothetical protein